MATMAVSHDSGLPVITLEVNNRQLNFTFAPEVGRKSVDQVESDLVMLPKLYQRSFHPALKLGESSAADVIKRTIRDEFPGKHGTFKLVPVRNSGRAYMLTGLGQDCSYSGKTACFVFENLLRQALERGAKTVTIPFVPTPATQKSMSHKITAFKLKQVAQRVLETHQGATSLKEIKIYCHPAAVRSIADGLRIRRGDGCACRTKPK